jgi:cephalosporin-C deacetylase
VSVRRPSREIEVYEFNTHEGGEGFQRDRQLRWFTTLTG